MKNTQLLSKMLGDPNLNLFCISLDKLLSKQVEKMKQSLTKKLERNKLLLEIISCLQKMPNLSGEILINTEMDLSQPIKFKDSSKMRHNLLFHLIRHTILMTHSMCKTEMEELLNKNLSMYLPVDSKKAQEKVKVKWKRKKWKEWKEWNKMMVSNFKIEINNNNKLQSS